MALARYQVIPGETLSIEKTLPIEETLPMEETLSIEKPFSSKASDN